MPGSAAGSAGRPTHWEQAAATAPAADAAVEFIDGSLPESHCDNDHDDEGAELEQQGQPELPAEEEEEEQPSGGWQAEQAQLPGATGGISLRQRRSSERPGAGAPPPEPRRCLECGSSNKHGKSWMRHAVTKAEWLCEPCYRKSYQPIRKARQAAAKQQLKQEVDAVLEQYEQQAQEWAAAHWGEEPLRPAGARKRFARSAEQQAAAKQPRLSGCNEALALLTAAAEGEAQHSGSGEGVGAAAVGELEAPDAGGEYAVAESDQSDPPAAARQPRNGRACMIAGSVIAAALRAEIAEQAAEAQRQLAEGLLPGVQQQHSPQHSAPHGPQLSTPHSPQHSTSQQAQHNTQQAQQAQQAQQPQQPQQPQQEEEEQQLPQLLTPPAVAKQHGAAAVPAHYPRDPRRAPAAAQMVSAQPPPAEAAPVLLLRRLLSSWVEAAVVHSCEALRYTAYFLLLPAEQQQQELQLLEDLAAEAAGAEPAAQEHMCETAHAFVRCGGNRLLRST